MSKGRLLLVRFALWIIALLSLVTISQFFRALGTAWLDSNSADLVTCFEQRFEPIRPFLPKNGIIGYVTEAPPEAIHTDPSAGAEYILTQYGLGPVVVDSVPRHDILIGNFHAAQPPDISAFGRFAIVKDAGTGIVIYRKEDMKP